MTGATYNLESRMTGNTLGNGVVQTWDFDDDRSQLVSQTAIKGANELLNLAYAYDAAAGQSGVTSTAGNSHQLISLTGTINGTTESASYTYDLQKRLTTSSQTSNGVSAQRRFAYDRWGNRTGVWNAVAGGSQIQSITLEQSGGAPTNQIETVYPQKTNFALPANGATAVASSTFDSSYPASGAINGDRKGLNWGNGGGWMGAAKNNQDWIEVDFSSSKTIDEIDVFTLQDNYTSPSEPTETMTFSLYGIVDFQVQYWNGSSWVTVSGGSVAGNNKVWKKFTFSQISTTKIRVNVTNSLGYVRVTEVEAWGPNPGVTYEYDAVGNVIDDGPHSYTYDAANRLVSVDGGATAQYQYDHQNQRVTKIVGSSRTHYIWEGGQVIGEHDATTPHSTNPPYQEASARLDCIYAHGKMIQTRERTSSTGSWTTRYYISDVWSTKLVLDTSGNVLGRQGHLPFGEQFASSGTLEKHHFTSYEVDSETGTDYAVNRQYSQNLGRFGSADPYQASSFQFSPQSWNRYSYVENDPIHNVDPLGLLLAFPGPGPDSCCTSFTSCTSIGGDDSAQADPTMIDYFPGFGSAAAESISGAILEAHRLLRDPGCQERLAAQEHGGRPVSVPALLVRLLSLSIRPKGEDTSQPGSRSVFNGQTSRIPGVVVRRNLGDTASTLGTDWMFIYSNFFIPVRINARMSLLLSQAVVIIHELLHMQGFGETEFGMEIDTFIIRSCINRRWSKNDMAM